MRPRTCHPRNYLGGSAYLIYGINGGYASLGPSVCAPIGGAGPYPCTVQLLNLGVGATSDYQPNHIATNVNNSCNPATNSCNPLRFYPYGMGYYEWGFGGGVMGLGDVTGDAFADVAVAGDPAWVGPGHLFVYSGSQNGLQVANIPSAQPACSGGVCTPYYYLPPATGTFAPTNSLSMSYYLKGWSESGDIDGDGKRDFIAHLLDD